MNLSAKVDRQQATISELTRRLEASEALGATAAREAAAASSAELASGAMGGSDRLLMQAVLVATQDERLDGRFQRMGGGGGGAEIVNEDDDEKEDGEGSHIASAAVPLSPATLAAELKIENDPYAFPRTRHIMPAPRCRRMS